MNKMNEKPKLPSCCEVPMKFHGTCCGWINASWIDNPQPEEDKAAMWDRRKAIEALPDCPMKRGMMSLYQST